jgi:hypothetical protein
MSIKYTEQEAIQLLNKEMVSGITKLYDSDCVKWGEKTSKGIYYSEIIARELLNYLKEFDNVKQITRTSPYRVPSHQQVSFDLDKSNRLEDIFAKRICGLEFEELGKILDYQVPIRDTNKDKGLKAFDLLSYNESDNCLYLIELKYLNSGETLLRAILEGYTYFRIVDHEKLKSDYKGIAKIDDNTVVMPVVLLVNSNKQQCKPYQEYQEMERDERPKLKALSLALEIKFVTCELPYIFESF